MSKFGVIIGSIFAVLVFSALSPAAEKGVYYCPMHPSYTSDRPGTCPICNMSLVKKETGLLPKSDVNSDRAVIRLDGQKRQMIGVKTSLVENKKIFRTIRVYGKVSRDPRWVYAQVFEYERPFLYKGERPLTGVNHKAQVEIPSLPGKTFSGKVRLIDREMDPVTRTTLVRIQLDKWEKSLKPDMSANIYIKIDLGLSVVVPQSAIVDTGLRQVVFVDRTDGLIEPRVIVAGEKGDEYTQVVRGLHPGETVVTGGNFLVDSESRLKAVLQDADAEESVVEGHRHGQ